MKDFNDDYDYLGNSASATDCTGLISQAPVGEIQEENYEDVYKYLPPKVKIDEKEK